MIGLSIRLALALGLHLRNEDVALDESRRDARVHVWWSLHAIECLLSTVTGRPPSVAFEYCTVPLPYVPRIEHHESRNTSGKATYRPKDDKSSHMVGSSTPSETPSSIRSAERFRIGKTDLSLISQKALLHLYSPLTASHSWEVCSLPFRKALNPCF